MTPQETDPDLPVSVQESPGEAWVGGGLLQCWGGTKCSSAHTGQFEGGRRYLKYLHHPLVSVDGWSCVPSLLFTWGQTMVEVTKTMATSFKRSHACTATLSAPSPASGHHTQVVWLHDYQGALESELYVVLITKHSALA